MPNAPPVTECAPSEEVISLPQPSSPQIGPISFPPTGTKICQCKPGYIEMGDGYCASKAIDEEEPCARSLPPIASLDRPTI
jgi:hypothetical protein